jgi:hypothetical protein
MLIITHPNKPGAGELQVLGEGKVGFESAIATCSHCQRVVQIHKKDAPYGYCRKCDHVICEFCAPKYIHEGCSPFKAAIDKFQEEQLRLSHSYPLAG